MSKTVVKSKVRRDCEDHRRGGCISASQSNAADAFLNELEKLTETLEIPTLAGYGIDKDEFISLYR